MSYESLINSLDGNGTMSLISRWKMGDANLAANPDEIPDTGGGGNHAVSNANDNLALADPIFPGGPRALQSDGDARVNLGTVSLGNADFTFACQCILPDVTSFPGIVSTATFAGADELTPMAITNAGVLRTVWDGNTQDWASVVPDDGERHFLVLVGDRDGDMTIYYDGEAAGTVDISAQSAASWTWFGPRFYDRNNVRLPAGSQIADVQQWSGAMSASQVAALYSALTSPPSPLLIPGPTTGGLTFGLTNPLTKGL